VKFHSNSNAKSFICSKVINRLGCHRAGWSYQDFETTFLRFVENLALDQTIKEVERETMALLARHIEALSAADVFDTRIGIATILKSAVSDLKIASAGAEPPVGKLNDRIRRDRPGRYFEVAFHGGSPHTSFPVVST
jgi:hypothetical protein